MQRIRAAVKAGVWGPTGHGPPPTDDLTPPTRDALFLFQLQKNDTTALTAESLRVAKICETDQYANTVFRALIKTGVIVQSTGHPDTTKIDKSLVSKIAVISVPKQRELVNMMFFWEEELTRWRVLDEEAAEMEQFNREGGAKGHDDGELEERLRIIATMKKVLPSLRKEDGSLTSAAWNPPEYTA